MKKVLVLMLVLALSTAANAYVISVTNSVGSISGNMGTDNGADALVVGDVVNIKIELNDSGMGTPASYEGYVLRGMGLDLTVSGNGTLAELGTLKTTKFLMATELAPQTQPLPLIVGNAIIAFGGAAPLAGMSPQTMITGNDLAWNLTVTVTDANPIYLDLSLNAGMGATQYADYWYGAWKTATNADLGDLALNVPEPMTIALLGLGGLFLRRRK